MTTWLYYYYVMVWCIVLCCVVFVLFDIMFEIMFDIIITLVCKVHEPRRRKHSRLMMYCVCRTLSSVDTPGNTGNKNLQVCQPYKIPIRHVPTYF